MENNKKVVIITDDSALIRELAENIAAVIGGCPGYSATVVQADCFSGADILPAQAFFLGCEAPKQAAFLPVKILFEHINLVGRPCGVFSSNSKTLKYLSILVRDSESALGKPFLAKNGAADRAKLQNWVQTILKERA